MRAYMYEPDPDWVPFWWLHEEMFGKDETELDIPEDEWEEYQRVVDYVENLHKKIEEWKNG